VGGCAASGWTGCVGGVGGVMEVWGESRWRAMQGFRYWGLWRFGCAVIIGIEGSMALVWLLDIVSGGLICGRRNLLFESGEGCSGGFWL
jgi:hypothetical protein